MDFLPKSALLCALAALAAACLPSALIAEPQAAVQNIAMVSRAEDVEIEITCSSPVTPESQVVNNPLRLVVDLPQAIPGGNLRNLVVNRGQVKDVRMGLFRAQPPITRIVLDLKAPQSYQVLTSGNRVLVKIGESGTPMQTVSAKSVSPQSMPEASQTLAVAPAPVPAPPPKPAPKVLVRLQNGLLSIHAEKVSLAEVLSEIQRRTGADIPIPAGTDQELVVAKIDPLPPEAALAALLNGSRFNFILVGSAANPSALQSVILTPKSGLQQGIVISSVAPAPEPMNQAAASAAPSDEGDDEDGPDTDDPPPTQPPQQH